MSGGKKILAGLKLFENAADYADGGVCGDRGDVYSGTVCRDRNRHTGVCCDHEGGSGVLVSVSG